MPIMDITNFMWNIMLRKDYLFSPFLFTYPWLSFTPLGLHIGLDKNENILHYTTYCFFLYKGILTKKKETHMDKQTFCFSGIITLWLRV